MKSDQSSEETRLKIRAEALQALSPRALHNWKSEISQIARTILSNVPADHPFDLVCEYARPICDALANLVTGIAPSDAELLTPLTDQVSAAAAEPFDESLALRAKVADSELRKYFHSGPLALRESGFVALSQTLRRLLVNAWFALVQHPEEWDRLHREPALTRRAAEELLRYAGLPRMLFRMAKQSVNIEGTNIREGDRVILRLTAANRDQDRFPNADRLQITRDFTRHFSLGSGCHSCVGAPLLRMALITTTRILVERHSHAALCQPVEWEGGSGFVSPTALIVRLQR